MILLTVPKRLALFSAILTAMAAFFLSKPSEVLPWKCAPIHLISEQQFFDQTSAHFNSYLTRPTAARGGGTEGHDATVGRKIFSDMRQPITPDQWGAFHKEKTDVFHYLFSNEPAVWLTIGDEPYRFSEQNYFFSFDGCGRLISSTAGVPSFSIK